MAEDLSDRIEEAAAAPASVTTDGFSVTNPRLSELIAADEYLTAKRAASKKHRGLRFTKIVPPGAG